MLPSVQGQVEKNGYISPFLLLFLQSCQFQKLLSPTYLKGKVHFSLGHLWLRVTLERKCFGLSVGQVFTSGDCCKCLKWHLQVIASWREH